MHLSLSFSVIVQVIQGLECLVNLEKLFLGKNKITKIEVLNNMHTCYMYMHVHVKLTWCVMSGSYM